jgi:hypothetical protein
MSFGHHGAYSIAVFPGVIIVRAFSSWNEECARSYRAELAEKLAQVSVSPFIHIIDQRSWDLATPEAMLLLAEDFPCPRPEHHLASLVLDNPLPAVNLIARQSIEGNIQKVSHYDSLAELMDAVNGFQVDCDPVQIRAFLEDQPVS